MTCLSPYTWHMYLYISRRNSSRASVASTIQFRLDALSLLRLPKITKISINYENPYLFLRYPITEQLKGKEENPFRIPRDGTFKFQMVAPYQLQVPGAQQ